MSNHSIKIRAGKPKDVGTLLEMIKELAVYEKALDEVKTTEKQLLADGFGSQPLYGFFIAELEGKAVGMALYYYRYSTWKGKSLYLEDLYVKEKYRQYKAGFHLFKAIAQKAQDESCHRISWQVLDWNEPAIKFYKKLGAELDAEWINGHLSKSQYTHLLE
ncbi:GNAT family N-acetyltransferase [uncultured Microscilla sp.]|uniref:GNAT family N-acetyltransferase n=1 Tax=uncultured Microscilla sp. TaxID=432653 RepID=UPI0026290F2F|nr:GNAT family N-acetyltransferase [uncultured Microscilla sp.]